MEKISKSKIQNPKSSESGITLVVSLIILASVTFISFVLSSIIIREIIAARLLTQTEPAISAAEGGAEITAYTYMRSLGDPPSNCPAMQNGGQCQVSPNLYDNPLRITDPSPVVSAGLYDANNPNNQTLAYRSVKVENFPSAGPVAVTVVSFADPGTPLCSDTVQPNDFMICNLPGPDFRTLITMDWGTGGTDRGKITAFDQNNAQGSSVGIPSAQPSFDITGSLGQVQRKIRIDFK